MAEAPFSVPLYGNQENVERFARDGRRIIKEFFELYFHSMVWVDRTRWFGIPVLKPPGDLWTLQELIAELRPDLIIETGTAHGGSAAFMAGMLDLARAGRVITIDPETYPDRPQHERIEYWTMSSTDPSTLERLKPIVAGCSTVMVILDSLHSTHHVRQEIALYAPLVTVGSYLLVEDGCVDGNPVLPNFVDPGDQQPGGPQAAIQEFLANTDAFQVDNTRHKFLMTFNPNGYLKRVR